MFVASTGAETIIWKRVGPLPQILGGQVNPVVVSAPTMPCQAPVPKKSVGGLAAVKPSKPELNRRLAEPCGSGDEGDVESTRIEFRLKYCWSATILRTCRPAVSGTPSCPTHWKVFQLPVLGTRTLPVMLMPSISMWKALLENMLLARSSTSYWALVAKLTV